MTLGDRIRQAREQAGISQAELARRIGISKNAMNTIEGGQSDPRVSRIVAIALVLGVSTDTLLDIQEKPQAPPKRQRTHKAAPVG